MTDKVDTAQLRVIWKEAADELDALRAERDTLQQQLAEARNKWVSLCIKCGRPKMFPTWHRKRSPEEARECNAFDVAQSFEEHLHYKCACGFDWITPIAAIESTGEPDALQAQLAEARELIKRHEDALEWLSDTPDYDNLHKNCQSGMYALCRIGEGEGISFAMKTPLAAIEAASKEAKP